MNDTKTFTPIYQVYYDGGWHDKETNEMWAYPADGGWEVRVLYEATILNVEPCAVCGEGAARLVVLRSCDTCESEYAGQAEMRLTLGLVQPPEATPELLSWHEIFELAQLHSVTPNENLVSFTRSVEAIIGTKT